MFDFMLNSTIFYDSYLHNSYERAGAGEKWFSYLFMTPIERVNILLINKQTITLPLTCSLARDCNKKSRSHRLPARRKKIDVFDKLFCKYTYSLYSSRAGTLHEISVWLFAYLRPHERHKFWFSIHSLSFPFRNGARWSVCTRSCERARAARFSFIIFIFLSLSWHFLR